MYGHLETLGPLCGWLLYFIGALFIGFFGAKLLIFTAYTAMMFYLLGASSFLCVVVGAILIFFNLKPLRQVLLSTPIMKIMDKMGMMPVISETERTALEAGTTWIDAELFSGKPNFKEIQKEPFPKLTPEEQAFMDGPVKDVCNMTCDWDISQRGDLTPEVWQFLKDKKFLGLCIPVKDGGLGFSAFAHSEVIARLVGRSVPLCVSVMVPNSLGPGELIMHYGTDEQKKKYLPRLADGREIPCFALTEPTAGSDAGAITSSAVLFKDSDGTLKLKLNWDKRYITLAAISTLIGLAVKLRDPDNLLGKGEDLGITCVLVPAETPGVVLGKRHNPMGVPFFNCPTKGHDVIVDANQIIGGIEGAGRGWIMLMESLAAGRAISLPSQCAGGAKACLTVASCYSTVRRQFGVAIGKFEGIEEPIARVTGTTYWMEACRRFTAGAVNSGHKPAVVSAMAKYFQTEAARRNINDIMDVMGGAAISRGPRNLVANAYIGTPIGITVEGANILTRTMIIFGQGAIRCHPYAYKEVQALLANDGKAFDHNFWGHIGHVVRNTCRAFLLSITRGRLASVPSGPCAKWYRKLSWCSAVYAIMADVAMGTLGGSLKMKEKLTGRYADALMWMYIATSTIRYFEERGSRDDERDALEWVMRESMVNIQDAFDGIFANFDIPILKQFFSWPIAFWSRLNRLSNGPSDALGHRLAVQIQEPSEFRDGLLDGVFISDDENDQGHKLNATFIACNKSLEILATIRKGVKAKKIPKGRPTKLVSDALEAGVITKEEAELVENATAMRLDCIQVDDFDLDSFRVNLLDVKD
jgi:acyl-CoA dehydrogenase